MWWHSTTKDEKSIVTIMDSRIKTTIGIGWFVQTNGVVKLIMIFLEVK